LQVIAGGGDDDDDDDGGGDDDDDGGDDDYDDGGDDDDDHDDDGCHASIAPTTIRHLVVCNVCCSKVQAPTHVLVTMITLITMSTRMMITII